MCVLSAAPHKPKVPLFILVDELMQFIIQLLPNDEREQERLNFMHQLFRLTLDGDLCYTKLENPQKILDLGTGTGCWALDSK
jgi:methylase of polypeptide subunit release factors